jgi:hypothetical protein
MMTIVISSPTLILDFEEEELRQKYNSLVSSILSGKLAQFPIPNLKVREDACSIEELGYRARVFLLTYLDRLQVKRTILKYNLDSFITDVISIDVSSTDILNKVSSRVRGKWILLTENEAEASWFTRLGVNSVTVGKGGKFSSIYGFVDYTSSHRVDKDLYVSKGCGI